MARPRPSKSIPVVRRKPSRTPGAKAVPTTKVSGKAAPAAKAAPTKVSGRAPPAAPAKTSQRSSPSSGARRTIESLIKKAYKDEQARRQKQEKRLASARQKAKKQSAALSRRLKDWKVSEAHDAATRSKYDVLSAKLGAEANRVAVLNELKDLRTPRSVRMTMAPPTSRWPSGTRRLSSRRS